MPSGYTTTGALADSLPTVIASARLIREYEGVMPRLVDRQRLGEGEGLTWNEISLSKLTAQGVTETTVLDNPQQMVDTLLSATPVVIGIQTIVTDRTMRRISKNVAAKLGSLAQNAIQRKKDIDGLTQLDSFSTSQPGAGNTLSHGHIAAAVANIQGNTTETGIGEGAIYTVLHPFQIKDIQDEVLAGVGTYAVPQGLTADVFRNGFSGSVANSEVYAAGNMTIDANSDAKGGTFARNAIVLVEGHSPKAESRRRPEIGGGADEMFMYDEYIYAERNDAWGFELFSDATAPTS